MPDRIQPWASPSGTETSYSTSPMQTYLNSR